MAYVISDAGIEVVPTGSLGVRFKATGGSSLPSDISVTAVGTDATYEFAGLTLVSDPDATWQVVELTGVAPYGDVYEVTVAFDSVTVHTETVEVANPGKRRARVLRQRVYEVLNSLYLDGEIEADPYGDEYAPASVNTEFKGKGGSFIEVGVAYGDSYEQGPGYSQATSQVVIPLNVYGSIDDAEDAEEISSDFEEVVTNLMKQDWRMAGFGVIQSSATYQGAQPEILDDRKLAVVRGTMKVALRAQL